MTVNTLVQTLNKIPKDSLHNSKPTWWLHSRMHFSFADYFDPKRMQFGNLRVVNDDLVKPKAGFGTHPHRDYEIFSYVIDGWLSHRDSMGSKESLTRGAVQYLSAGTGITHSEVNDHDQTCRFLQIWVKPDKKGHTPQYGSKSYDSTDRQNKWLQILGGTQETPKWYNGVPSHIKLHQDVNVFVSETTSNFEQSMTLQKNRQSYVVCIEGDVKINDNELTERDALTAVASKQDDSQLVFKSGPQGAHYLVVDLQQE